MKSSRRYWRPDESLYGLGQYNDSYMDYRGQELMVQTNIGSRGADADLDAPLRNPLGHLFKVDLQGLGRGRIVLG